MEYQPIVKLSDAVIGQIAAGEVVERPAAAVKELVENSIDAGATAITVELRDGGISYLRVSDNGTGIPAGQVRMAFERHATSKLHTAEDLYNVRTLGFRGEALASIAAVSKVTLISRTAEAEYGVRVQVEAGSIGEIAEAASPVGTTITVRDLFFNTPVRLKFLKKPIAEAGLVSDFIMRLILSRPDVAFRFVSQGKTVYRSAGDGTLESALYCVYGKDALRVMRRVKGFSGGVLVDGYVGVGEESRGNRLQQSFFVNGRYFRNEVLSKALENACEGFVMIGRFPTCALQLTIPTHLVDVNVHPNKLEVRFQNPDAVASAVADAAREALAPVTLQEVLVAGLDEAPPEAQGFEVFALGRDENADQGSTLSMADYRETAAPMLREPVTLYSQEAATPMGTVESIPFEGLSSPSWGEPLQGFRRTRSDLPAVPEQPSQPDPVSGIPWDGSNRGAMALPLAAPPHSAAAVDAPRLTLHSHVEAVQEQMPEMASHIALRFIGSVFKTYLLFESGERLLMVDQHAAHERVLYDRLMARYEGPGASQPLLAPQVLRFTARDVGMLRELNEALTEAGFELEPFDETSVAVRAAPVILGQNEPIRELLLDVLDETSTQRGKLTRERLRRHVTQMACKHAIKAGDTLSEDDVRQLLMQMLQSGAQPTCPHGRPIVSEISRRDLEKRFKRIQ